MDMEDSHSALLKSQLSKDEGNRLFRAKAYRMAIARYYNPLQHLYVVVHESDDDAWFMEELGIS